MPACFRAAFRLLCLATVYPLFFLGGAFAHVLFARNDKIRLRCIGLAGHWLGIFSCFVFNIRLTVVGGIDPDPRALIVANHIGTPDIFILGRCFRTFFVSKAALGDWHLLGKMIRLGETIFVNPERRHQVKGTLDEIQRRLEKGFSVALFPEAGVTTGEDIAGFKTAHFEAAIRARRPVIPVLIVYRDGHTPSIACWNDISFARHMLRLLRNPRLDATVYIFPARPDLKDRRILAAECRQLMRDTFMRARGKSALPSS